MVAPPAGNGQLENVVRQDNSEGITVITPRKKVSVVASDLMVRSPQRQRRRAGWSCMSLMNSGQE